VASGRLVEMRAFGLRRSAVSGAALFGGAAPDTTIIPPVLPALNPSFQFGFSPEGGRGFLSIASNETSRKCQPSTGPRVTQVGSGGLQSALRYPSSDNEAASLRQLRCFFPKMEIPKWKSGPDPTTVAPHLCFCDVGDRYSRAARPARVSLRHFTARNPT
jgi:hypothetical protein